MITPTHLLRRLRYLLGRTRRTGAVDEEMRFHLDMLTAALVREGLSPAEARARAEREFGSTMRVREEVGDAHGLTWLDDLWRDLRFGARALRRSAGYTTVALLTLALGIGGTVAVFTVVNSALLTPLPFREPDRIMTLWTAMEGGVDRMTVSVPNFRDWKAQSTSFDAMAIYGTGFGTRASIVGGSEPILAAAAQVSDEFFEVFGVPAVIGRAFQRGDGFGTQAPGMVLSHGFWQRAFGGDSAVIGTRLGVGSGRAYTVLGIMGEAFDFPRGTEVWIPMPDIQGAFWARNGINFRVVGRLSPDRAIEATQAELTVIARRLRETYPNREDNHADDITLSPLSTEVTADVQDALLLFQGAVVLVLLIGCANLAGAGLARGVVRQREMAVRAALGAGRRRLIRQLLTEHLLLGLAGGALGIAVALGLVRVFQATAPANLIPFTSLTMDSRAIAIALVLSVLVGLLVGLVPAWLGSRMDLRSSMVAGVGEGPGRAITGWTLVAAEVGLAVVLAVGATLLLQSFRNVLAQDTGVRVEGVLTAQVQLPGQRYRTTADRMPYWNTVLDQARATPGVLAAAAVNLAPLSIAGTAFLDVEGRTEPNEGAGFRLVTDDYFRAVGVRLVEGRSFTPADDAEHLPVTVINQALADREWPGESPLGKRVRSRGFDSQGDQWLTVIGVVNNIRYWSLEAEIRPELFVYYRQRPERLDAMTLVLHTQGSPQAFVPSLRGILHRADPEVPGSFSTLAERRGETVRDRRFIMTLLTGFAVFGLMLAALGIYGVLAYTTASRTREFGIRMALGSRRREVMVLVLRRAGVPVALGLIGGLAGAYGLVGLLRSMVYGLDPHDLRTFMFVVPVLIMAAAVACLIPARRAIRVDPIIALRSD